MLKHDNEDEKKYESCVLCGCLTNELIDEEIDFRNYYIEGAGQLCHDCFKKIYERKK